MNIRLTAAGAALAACTTICAGNGPASLATDSISHNDSIHRESSLARWLWWRAAPERHVWAEP